MFSGFSHGWQLSFAIGARTQRLVGAPPYRDLGNWLMCGWGHGWRCDAGRPYAAVSSSSEWRLDCERRRVPRPANSASTPSPHVAPIRPLTHSLAFVAEAVDARSIVLVVDRHAVTVVEGPGEPPRCQALRSLLHSYNSSRALPTDHSRECCSNPTYVLVHMRADRDATTAP